MVFDVFEFEHEYPGELEFDEIQPYVEIGPNFYNFSDNRLRTCHLDRLINLSNLVDEKCVRVELISNGHFLVVCLIDSNLNAYIIRDYEIIAQRSRLIKNVIDISEFHTASCNNLVFLSVNSGHSVTLLVINSLLEILKSNSINTCRLISADESYLYVLNDKEIQFLDHNLNKVFTISLKTSLTDWQLREFKVNKNSFFLIDNEYYARSGDIHSGELVKKFCTNALSFVFINDKVYILEKFNNVNGNLRLISYDLNGKYVRTFHLNFDSDVDKVLFNKTNNKLAFMDSKNFIFYEILEPFNIV